MVTSGEKWPKRVVLRVCLTRPGHRTRPCGELRMMNDVVDTEDY